MRVSLDGLEAVEAVARLGSFAAAAQSLHKVQSAVSYAVRQLEAALGVTVFDRSGYRATLTGAGVAVLAHAQSILAAVGRLQATSQALDSGYEAQLQVVVDGAVPMEPLLKTLRALGAGGVPTHVRVRVEYLGGVAEAFERDRADVMVTMEQVRTPALAVHSLPPLHLVLVASPRHPLGAGARSHTLEALQQHVELSIHDTSAATAGRNTHQFGGQRVFYLGDFATKRQALLMGLGFGFMPEHLVAADLGRKRLVQLNTVVGHRRVLQPLLVHPVSRPLGRTGQMLLRLLTQHWPARTQRRRAAAG